MYLIYSLALTIGFVLLSPRFLWDALTKGKYASGFWQRFGFLPEFDFSNQKIIWLHCVSVGETNAARPIVARLKRSFPDYKIVVSTTTKTGQKLAREVFAKDAALIFYFPFDWRFVARRVLRRINPQMILIVETELWFNFLREAKQQNRKIALVNGRLSEKSFRNYSLIAKFMRRVLANLDAAIMSGDADAEKIIELGCAPEKVVVAGNVKFDLTIEAAESELTNAFRARFAFDGARPLIVAASTHEPEENIILQAFARLRGRGDAAAAPRLLIVPRHPERFDAVARTIEKSGFAFVRRSAAQTAIDNRADVVLLDSVGELRATFPLAEIVFVGGSLIAHGGQNVLEPVAARKAVVTGFYTHNFARIIEILRCADAVVQLPEIEAASAAELLAEKFAELLANPARRAALAANAFAVLHSNQGATEKTVRCLKSMLLD